MFTPTYHPMRTKAGGKIYLQICKNKKPAISSRHSIPYTLFEDWRRSAFTVLVMPEVFTTISDPMRAKAEGKFFTPDLPQQ